MKQYLDIVTRTRVVFDGLTVSPDAPGVQAHLDTVLNRVDDGRHTFCTETYRRALQEMMKGSVHQALTDSLGENEVDYGAALRATDNLMRETRVYLEEQISVTVSSPLLVTVHYRVLDGKQSLAEIFREDVLMKSITCEYGTYPSITTRVEQFCNDNGYAIEHTEWARHGS